MFKLEFINAKDESIELFSHPYLLYRFEGLGDTGVLNQTQKSMNQDGGTLVESLMDEKFPVIELKITGNTQEELALNRRRLTSVFNPKLGEGRLIRRSNDGIHVLKVIPEAVPFYPDGLGNRGRHHQKALINLRAANPYWQDLTSTKSEIALWVGGIEFPIEIPQEGIEMGYREPSLIVNVLNDGDVEAGMKIEFKALATVVNPSLFNVNTREFLKINRTLEAGEVVTVTTHFQQKRVESSLNGVTQNIFNDIDIESTFLQLDVGDNLFRYDADESIENLEISIYHTQQYLGV